MVNNIVINVNDEGYILTGSLDLITSNRRCMSAFRRLGIESNDTAIIIKVEPMLRIRALQHLVAVFEKFSIPYVYDSTIKEQLNSYSEEQENFQNFAQNAKYIRDNDFKNNDNLLNSFKEFLNVLDAVMVNRDLYKLQKLSSFHMAFAQNSCNFAVPGAGKTAIVYGAYAYLRNLPKTNPRHVNKLLVIGPLSSFAPWEDEYEECFGRPISSQRLSGDQSIKRGTKTEHLYATTPKELTLISHAGIQSLKNEIIDFIQTNQVMVVVDEAHRIKNVNGVWGRIAIEIAKSAKSRVILTGTPAPNGYEDLYNLFRFIYPYKFREILKIHHAQLKELTKNSATEENDIRVKELISNLQPFFIRIKKSDLKLPAVKEKTIEISMDSKQREIYDYIEEKYVKSFSKNRAATVRDALNKAKLIRLRQAATNPSLLLDALRDTMEGSSDYDADPNIKYAKLYDEGIDDSTILHKIKHYNDNITPTKYSEILKLVKNNILPQGGKVIIWTIFIKNADLLKDYLYKNDVRSKLLIGRIHPDEREIIIKKFNNPLNSEFSVVIANPFSVAESISLHQGCHNAIYMERDYQAANFLQSKDRIHRVGLPQGTVTNYYYFVAKHSIDGVINTKLNEKVQRMEAIIDKDIPLFAGIDDNDETDIITALLNDYAKRT